MMATWDLHEGDCLDVMATFADCTFDTLICDPPSGISFMGKSWDNHSRYEARSEKGIQTQAALLTLGVAPWEAGFAAFTVDWALAAIRVLKPGAMGLVWALPRTSDLTGLGLRMAGFQLKEKFYHAFGSGFPKSLDVGKALDRAAGMEREKLGLSPNRRPGHENGKSWKQSSPDSMNYCITAPATDAAKLWEGWGTATKPAVEEWILVMRPIEKNFAYNAQKWGVAGLWVDGARVGYVNDDDKKSATPQGKCVWKPGRLAGDIDGVGTVEGKRPQQTGRWPANLLLDGSPEVTALFPVSTSTGGTVRRNGVFLANNDKEFPFHHYGDTGSAARFFQACPPDDEATRLLYCAKASRSEREAGLDSTCTVKYNIDKSNVDFTGDLSWKDVSMVLVELLKRATSELTAKWLIDESGESITGLCPSDSLSITLTEVNKITELKILNLLTPLLISDCIAGASCATENGGSRAENAGNLSKSPQTIMNEKAGVLARGVRFVVSPMLSTISDGANWKPLTNIHSTVKPLSLLRYLCRITRAPTGGKVLDPFCGSGTTGAACVLEGRDFVGIEREPEYVEIARRRMAHYAEQAEREAVQPTLFEAS